MFARTASGYEGAFSSAQLRVVGIPFRRIRYEESRLSWELVGDATTAVFEGTVLDDTLAGRFREGDATGTFRLTRGTRTVPQVQEEEVTFGNGPVTLRGTVIYPAGPGPFSWRRLPPRVGSGGPLGLALLGKRVRATRHRGAHLRQAGGRNLNRSMARRGFCGAGGGCFGGGGGPALAAADLPGSRWHPRPQSGRHDRPVGGKRESTRFFVSKSARTQEGDPRRRRLHPDGRVVTWPWSQTSGLSARRAISRMSNMTYFRSRKRLSA